MIFYIRYKKLYIETWPGNIKKSHINNYQKIYCIYIQQFVKDGPLSVYVIGNCILSLPSQAFSCWFLNGQLGKQVNELSIALRYFFIQYKMLNVSATLFSSRLGTITLDIMSITQQMFYISYQFPWGLGKL